MDLQKQRHVVSPPDSIPWKTFLAFDPRQSQDGRHEQDAVVRPLFSSPRDQFGGLPRYLRSLVLLVIEDGWPQTKRGGAFFTAIS